MKNLLLPIAAVFFSTIIYGQVGVNTTSPKSTFDINAKNERGTSSLTDGLLIPRVDRQRALSMTSVEPSTLIYVNDIATGTATGQASNIDALGFYYFDGLSGKWSKLTTGSFSGDPTKDAFVDDAANAMVKLGETTSGTVRVAGSEFVIKDNGAVGIGTASPTQKLDVVGKGQFSEKVTIGSNWTGAALSVDNAISSEPILTLSDTNSVRKVTVNNNGNVGIGTDSPTQKLDVEGNARIRNVPTSSLGSTDSYLGIANDGTLKKANVNLPGFALFATKTNSVSHNNGSSKYNLDFNNVQKIDGGIIAATAYQNTFKALRYGLYTIEVWAKYSGIDEFSSGSSQGCRVILRPGGSNNEVSQIGYMNIDGSGYTGLTRTAILNVNEEVSVYTSCNRSSGTYYTSPDSTILITYLPL